MERSSNRFILVIAGNYQQYDDFCRANPEHRQSFIFVGDERRLRGYRDQDVLIIGSPTEFSLKLEHEADVIGMNLYWF